MAFGAGGQAMIDSIVWELQSGQYEIQDKNKLYSKRASGGKGFFNGSADSWEYSKSQHKKNRYFPFIKRATRKSGNKDEKETLEIQTSLPKAIYGTSILEVDESDYNAIIGATNGHLREAGVITATNALELATLKRVDFSKIVILPPYLGKAPQALLKLSQFNYKPSSDFNLNRYFDGDSGMGVKFWNTTQGYVIYDKIGELIQRGYTDFENDLIIKLNENQKRSVLKFELAIQNKRSLESVVGKRLQGKAMKNLTLQDVLNKDLAKQILLDNFIRTFDSTALGLLTLAEMQDNELLVYLEKSGLNHKKQIDLYYWVSMTTKFGIKAVWEMIADEYKGGSVTRIKKEIALALAELPKLGGNLPNLTDFLRQEHEKFELIKPSEKTRCQLLLNKV